MAFSRSLSLQARTSPSLVVSLLLGCQHGLMEPPPTRWSSQMAGKRNAQAARLRSRFRTRYLTSSWSFSSRTLVMAQVQSPLNARIIGILPTPKRWAHSPWRWKTMKRLETLSPLTRLGTSPSKPTLWKRWTWQQKDLSSLSCSTSRTAPRLGRKHPLCQFRLMSASQCNSPWEPYRLIILAATSSIPSQKTCPWTELHWAHIRVMKPAEWECSIVPAAALTWSDQTPKKCTPTTKPSNLVALETTSSSRVARQATTLAPPEMPSLSSPP